MLQRNQDKYYPEIGASKILVKMATLRTNTYSVSEVPQSQ